MGRIWVAVLLAAIIVVQWAPGQVARADSPPADRVVVILADRGAVRGSDGGADLVTSAVGLLSALGEGQRFAFVAMDNPTEPIGPVAATEADLKGFRRQVEAKLSLAAPPLEPDYVGSVAETFNLLGREGAGAGSTVFLVSGGSPSTDLGQAARRLRSTVSLFKERGWRLVGLSLPAASMEVHEFLDRISLDSGGGGSLGLSVPDGLKRLADEALGVGARGPLAPVADAQAAPNATFTSTLNLPPGTGKVALVVLKEDARGSVTLMNPQGSLVSIFDPAGAVVVETPHAVVWSLSEPPPGTWRVDVQGAVGGVTAWHAGINRYGLVLDSSGPIPLHQPTTLSGYATEGMERVVLDGARLQAIVTTPDGTELVHELNDEGRSGDAVANDGYFSAAIPPLSLEGEYRVGLELFWAGVEYRIRSQATFRAQIFPSIQLTPARTEDLSPGERSRVASVLVNVGGQPYAVSADELEAAVSSNTALEGLLEFEPQRPLDSGRAWLFDVFFTPQDEGLHTVVLRLGMEYSGRQHSYVTESLVLSSVMPPAPAAPAAISPPPPPPEVPQPDPQPVPVSSGFPMWGIVLSILAGAGLVAGGAYWLSRTPPHGYLYDERDELVVDFGNLERRPLSRLLFKNSVRGKELGVPGLEGVLFRFLGKRVGLVRDRSAPSVRVNNQPLDRDAPIYDRTWIGVQGKLYSFLASAPNPAPEPDAGGDS